MKLEGNFFVINFFLFRNQTKHRKKLKLSNSLTSLLSSTPIKRELQKNYEAFHEIKRLHA